MSKNRSSSRKRKADTSESVFDVEEHRVKSQKKNVENAAKKIPTLFEKLQQTIEESKLLVNAFNDESDKTDESYKECGKKLLELESLSGQLHRTFVERNNDHLRTAAERTFRLAQDQSFIKPSIIISDCAWTYTNSTHHVGTDAQYNTMSDEELCALPVAGLVNEDAVLLLWVTCPKLQAGLRVMRAWGFTYKTVFMVWVKTQRKLSRFTSNHGKFLSSNAEFILLGERGSMRTNERDFVHSCNVLFTPLRKHSQKPDILKNIAVELFGDLPRWSLFERFDDDFARMSMQDWVSWGDQVIADNNDDDDDNNNSDNDDTKNASIVQVGSKPESKTHKAKKVKQRQRNNWQNAFLVAKKKARMMIPKNKGHSKLRSEIKRFGYPSAFNTASKSDFVFYGDGTKVLGDDAIRANYRDILAKSVAQPEQLYRGTLESFIPSDDLRRNRRITDYTDDKKMVDLHLRARHAVYSDLTNQEVYDNIKTIRVFQQRNADVLYARNNNIKGSNVKYADRAQE